MNPGFWLERPVLVTGATGLLGAWIVRGLVQSEADVVAVIRDGVPGSMLHRDRLTDTITTVRGDVRDLPLLRRVMAEYSIDTVFHLAAQSSEHWGSSVRPTVTRVAVTL